jgi:hypothetical protein
MSMESDVRRVIVAVSALIHRALADLGGPCCAERYKA